MITKIIKRDGSLQDFDFKKIVDVVDRVHKEFPMDITFLNKKHNVVDYIKGKLSDKIKTVEQIQDLVFEAFCINGLIYPAKAFQEYRTRRMVLREQELEKTYADMDRILKSGSDENSNKNSTLLNVKRDLLAGEFYRNKLLQILPKNVAEAHSKKIIHYHDADFDARSTNCSIINVKDMLENGTKISNAYIGTPNSVEVAANIIMQIIFSVSNSQFGGVSVSDFNELLGEYAKKNFRKNFIDAIEFYNVLEKDYETTEEAVAEFEKVCGKISSDNEKLEKGNPDVFAWVKKKTDKDIYDACQLFEYQTNSLQNASQTPFSTITMTIPTSWESERVFYNYLQVRQKGLTNNKDKKTIAIFPKISMFVVDGQNLKEGDKYYWMLKEASKCIANTYYPDLLMISKEDFNNGKMYARMGCRSRVNHDYKENGVYKKYGRFNYGVITLNLVHLCLETLKEKGNIDMFIDKINKYSNTIMRDTFQFKYDNVKTLKAKEAPILFVDGAISRLNPDDTIEQLLRSDNCSLSFGYLGIDDCVRLLTDNKENISTDKGYELGMQIMNCLVDNVNKLKKEMNLPISLYSTPSEASIGTFFEKDKEQFGDIMPEWLLKREYYTNSFHFSSELPIDPFDKIQIESKFTQLANGGNISYVENGGKVYNTKAIIELIQHAYKCGTQYFAINTISDVCFKCGYTGEMNYDVNKHQYTCPNCGNTDGTQMKVQRRSCGYISNYNVTKAVKGRMKEITNRFVHTNLMKKESE